MLSGDDWEERYSLGGFPHSMVIQVLSCFVYYLWFYSKSVSGNFMNDDGLYKLVTVLI